MKKLLFLLVLSLAALGFLPSQSASPPLADDLAISTNVLVSLPGNLRPEEVTIAVNPLDPLNLVAGSNLDFFYYTFDGGHSWTEGQLTSPLGVWGDPCVIFDTEGNCYYGHLSRPPAETGDFLDRIVVQKSTDGGRTWSGGAGIGLNPPKDQDKDWLAADMTDSPFRGNLYLAWTEFDQYGSPNPSLQTRILFAVSSDHGESWSSPVTVSDIPGNCLDSDETVEGAVPAVGPNGEVYLSWSGPLGIVFDKSLDGGRTFGQDVLVTDQPGGWDLSVPGIYRCNGMPVTACDTSNSPYRGSVYIMWSDQRNGADDTDVFLSKSADSGKTWGPAIRVNDDPPGRHQFFPWMAVDQTSGHIYIVFYDRRDSSDIVTEVYLARSTDGGNTFQNCRVSEYSIRPASGIFFGDYINVVAHDGVIHAIWTRMDGIDMSVWSCLIEEGELPQGRKTRSVQ
jgi:hypothetical protein